MCKTFDDKSKKYKRNVIESDKIIYGRIGTYTSRHLQRENAKNHTLLLQSTVYEIVEHGEERKTQRSVAHGAEQFRN